MIIRYNGHACFTLESADGTIVFDPYKDGSVDGLPPLRIKGDKVLCSHYHGDHCGEECVEISGNEVSAEIGCIDSFHDEAKGTKRGKNRIHIVSAENMKIVHMGDQGCDPGAAAIEKIKGCDVLMIPVGGFYTIDADGALALIEKINPRVVIPMHYRGEGFGYSVLASKENFISKSFNPVRFPACEAEITPVTEKMTVDFAK